MTNSGALTFLLLNQQYFEAEHSFFSILIYRNEKTMKFS